MTTQLEHVVAELFPHGDSGAYNVKFFRGRAREVTSEQLAEQLRSANQQIVEERAIRVANIDADSIS